MEHHAVGGAAAAGRDTMSEVKDERDAEIDALDALGALADFAT